MRHAESDIQQACVSWFRWQYPRYAKLLFAVPNGGQRSAVEAKIMSGEGVMAGVADVFCWSLPMDITAFAWSSKEQRSVM